MVNSMTSGSPIRHIFRFMIPLLIGNLFALTHGMTEAFLLGRFLDSGALAALGAAIAITWICMDFANGLSIGSSYVTAQRFGAGDMPAVRRSFVACHIILLAQAIIITVLGLLFSRYFLTLMNVPDDIIDQAHAYSLVIFAGMVAYALVIVYANAMHAVGNSKTPLYFRSLISIAGIGFNLLFIIFYRMDIRGVAYSIVISQLISGTLFAIYVYRKVPALKISRADWKISFAELWDHLRLGLPLGVQQVVINMGFIATQFALNNLGPTTMAGFVAATRVAHFAFFPIMSFGVAAGTFAAQNYGAGKMRRVVKGLKQCCFASVAVCIFIGIMVQLFGVRVASIFIYGSPESISVAGTFLAVGSLFYWATSLVIIFRSTLLGIGKKVVPAISGFMEMIIGASLVLTLPRFLGHLGIAVAAPINTISLLTLLSIALFVTMRKLVAREDRLTEMGDEP